MLTFKQIEKRRDFVFWPEEKQRDLTLYKRLSIIHFIIKPCYIKEVSRTNSKRRGVDLTQGLHISLQEANEDVKVSPPK